MSHSPSPTPASQRPLLQQAPVVPLDASGLTASVVGMIIFAVVTVFFVWTGRGGEWVYVFATGTVIGAILIPVTAIHRYRQRRKQAALNPGPSVED